MPLYALEGVSPVVPQRMASSGSRPMPMSPARYGLRPMSRSGSARFCKAMTRIFSSVPALGHRLIKAHPESERSEFDVGEEVFGRFIVSRGHGAVMFDFVEEALDQVSVSVKIRTESRYVFAVWHGFDIGPCAAFVEALTQLIAVVGAIGQESLAFDESVEHVAPAAPIMDLAFG